MIDFFKTKKHENVDCKETMLTESFNNRYDLSESENRADEKFHAALGNLHLQYKLGKIPKINRAEREILEFCHERDMKEFLREEFEKHPIILDEEGGLVGGNPFERERRLKAQEITTHKEESVSLANNSDYEIL